MVTDEDPRAGDGAVSGAVSMIKHAQALIVKGLTAREAAVGLKVGKTVVYTALRSA
jgi:hypothetical protein